MSEVKPLPKRERARLMRRIARHVEKHPKFYEFMRVAFPTKREPCGCLLGHGGAMLGLRRTSRKGLDYVAQKLGFASDSDFYSAMDRTTDDAAWADHAAIAVAGLRKLADSVSPR